MDIVSRIRSLNQQLLMLVVLTAVLSIGGILTSIGVATDGETFGYTRIALGLLGVIGVIVMLLGNDNGKMGLMVIIAWAAIQTIYYADAPNGNFTRQVIDGLMGRSSSTTINGEVTEFSAFGINLIGLVMLILAYTSRNRLPKWQPSGMTA